MSKEYQTMFAVEYQGEYYSQCEGTTPKLKHATLYGTRTEAQDFADIWGGINGLDNNVVEIEVTTSCKRK